MMFLFLTPLTRFKVIIVSLLLLTGTAFMFRYQQREFVNLESIYRNDADVDELDFHFMAVNFAFDNQFPVIGYLNNPADYKIQFKKGKALGVDSMYLDMFKIAGPVHTFARPPLYSLVVGIIYKLFGYHLYVLIWFNILLVSAAASMLPYTGFRIYKAYGFFIGLAASLLMLLVSDFSFVTMDVEILAAFIYLLIFFTMLLIEDNPRPDYLFCLGLLIALEFLNKPTIIFLPLLYLLYYYFSLRKPALVTYLKKAVPLLAGVGLVLLPWSLYINHQKNITVAERENWAAHISASLEKPVIFNNVAEIQASSKNTAIALRNFVKIIYIYHTELDGGPILISNQFRKGISLLFLNNEFCASKIANMSSFGWLWKMVRNSYYNTHHLESSNIMKLFYFYLDNPAYLYKIPIVRLGLCNDYPWIFWFAPVLWALVVICLRIQTMKNNLTRRIFLLLLLIITAAAYYMASYPVEHQLFPAVFFAVICVGGLLLALKEYNSFLSAAYPVLWISIFLFILLVFGDTRFTKIALPVNCFAICLYSYLLFNQFIAPNRYKLSLKK